AMRLVAEVGGDDDVGNLPNPAERLEGAGHEGLAMHLAAEEIGEQRPDAVLGDLLAAVTVRKRPGEITGFEGKINVVRFAQPVLKMRDHMQEHLVAVGDQEGAT